MKWKPKTRAIPTQWHVKFLIFPRKIDGYWVWLETVERKWKKKIWEETGWMNLYEWRLKDQ